MKQRPFVHTSDFAEAEAEAFRAWMDLFTVTPLSVREAIAVAARDGADALADEFYERMMLRTRAHAFLDQESVQTRLRASMRRWLIELFATLDEDDLIKAIPRQIEVGVMHARIRLPIDLITAGFRVLKKGLRRRIDFTALDSHERYQALMYVSDLLHLVDSLMTQAYLRDAQEVVRNDEAYRRVTRKRSAAYERAKQRAALSEWAEGLLIDMLHQRPGIVPQRLRDSEFGVWMHHKGRVMFESLPDYQDLLTSIDTLDNVLLPKLMSDTTSEGFHEAVIGSVKGSLDLIRLKLNGLFEAITNPDEGLDEETQLLDRRYLPAILAREMQAHANNQLVFCLLLVNISFPSLKGLETAGMRARLLQAAVNTLQDCVRTTDHVFRFDEHRFLVIAVETSRGKAGELGNRIMEELRHALQSGHHQGTWKPVTPGVAVGVAEYDRHPDYQWLIQRAENALAQALQASRSRLAYG